MTHAYQKLWKLNFQKSFEFDLKGGTPHEAARGIRIYESKILGFGIPIRYIDFKHTKAGFEGCNAFNELRSSSSHVITRPRMLLFSSPRHVIPPADYFLMNTLHNTQSFGNCLSPIVYRTVLFKNFFHQISISLSVDVARKCQAQIAMWENFRQFRLRCVSRTVILSAF